MQQGFFLVWRTIFKKHSDNFGVARFPVAFALEEMPD